MVCACVSVSGRARVCLCVCVCVCLRTYVCIAHVSRFSVDSRGSVIRTVSAPQCRSAASKLLASLRVRRLHLLAFDLTVERFLGQRFQIVDALVDVGPKVEL